VEAVAERIRGEKRPWVRQRWEISFQALAAPRHAEDIARTVGVSLSTVHRVMSMYKQGGVAAIETTGKGGRRHQYLTLEQEHTFLKPFLERAARGEVATVGEIQCALEGQIGHKVNKGTLYRLLHRSGWQQRGASSSPSQAKESLPVQAETVLLRQRRA
jgi:transposase